MRPNMCLNIVLAPKKWVNQVKIRLEKVIIFAFQQKWFQLGVFLVLYHCYEVHFRDCIGNM